MAFLMGYNLQLPPHHLQPLCRLVPFPTFWINGEGLLPTGFSLIWLKATISIFRCGLLFCDFKQFNIKIAAAHCPVIQEEVQKLLANGPLSHPLVVLVSILICLWFLSVWVVYGLFSILSSLIAMCIYLLLRCPLFDRYCYLSNRVIMLSPLVFMVLIYIFLMFHIIINFLHFV